MLNSPDPEPEPEGVQEQVLEMLKMLLDPDTLDGSAGAGGQAGEWEGR